MKKNVFVFGSIAGLIVAGFMAFTAVACNSNADFEGSMVVGYASMLIAFSFVFIGIRNFRDKYNSGSITFGKAFILGLYMTLIASSIYVIVWLFEYYLFIPDFMENYTAHVLKQAREKGATEAEMAKQTAEMSSYSELYKNPLFVILFTYLEVLPVGLVVTLISALILKRKSQPGAEATA